MSRFIDADVLIKSLDDAIQDAKRKGEICDYWEDDRSNLLHYLDTAPTINAVEVVRCENCKHSEVEDSGFEDIMYWCDTFSDLVPSDGYCHDGERRSE